MANAISIVPGKYVAHSVVQTTAVNETSDGGKIQSSLEAKAGAGAEKKRFFTRPWGRHQIGILCALGFLGLALTALVIALPIYFTKIYGFAKDTDDYWKRPEPNEDHSYQLEENRPSFALHNFPDPGLIQHNGTWYAYGTNPKKRNPGSIHVPVATSTDFVNWTLHEDYDAMPTLGAWEKKANHWAPDVIQRVSIFMRIVPSSSFIHIYISRTTANLLCITLEKPRITAATIVWELPYQTAQAH